MTLHAHTPGRPFLYQLPYAFDPHATCPLTQAWLHESVGNDHGQVQLLRAFMKAVLTRRVDQQRYLENIGQGGTGKSTFMRLLTALIGRENVFITERNHLESNRFETSGLRHKPLMLVTDAERDSGPVNQLKAITGQDEVRMEEKYKKGSKDFAPVMVCISANEPIQSADYTSGLTRRRIAMAFRHKPAHPRDLLAWKDGQWVGELAAEIPCVLHWAMAMLDADVTTVLSDTETAVPTLHGLAKKAIIETNPLADWGNGHLVLDETKDEDGRLVARVNVGVAKKAEHSDRYEYEEIGLYPHYRAWVESTGNKAVAMRRFASMLEDLLVNQLGLAVEHRSDKSGSHFKGIRLRTANMKAKPLFYSTDIASVLEGTDTGMGYEPAPVTDVTDVRDIWTFFLRSPPPPSLWAWNGEKGREGGAIEKTEKAKIHKNPSHLSLVRPNGDADPSHSALRRVSDEDRLGHHEEARMQALAPLPVALDLPLTGSGAVQRCPRCGETDWCVSVTYRTCVRCGFKDNETPQESLTHSPPPSNGIPAGADEFDEGVL